MLDNIQFGPVIDVTKGRKKKRFLRNFFVFLLLQRLLNIGLLH